jgi:hypothetical protein
MSPFEKTDLMDDNRLFHVELGRVKGSHCEAAIFLYVITRPLFYFTSLRGHEVAVAISFYHNKGIASLRSQ